MEDKFDLSYYTDFKVSKSNNPILNVNIVTDTKGGKVQSVGVSSLGIGVGVSSSGGVSTSIKIGLFKAQFGLGVSMEGVTVSAKGSYSLDSKTDTGFGVNYKIGQIGYGIRAVILSRGTILNAAPYLGPVGKHAFKIKIEK